MSKMDPARLAAFAERRKAHHGAHLHFQIGLVYRGVVREFLNRGVMDDGLYYMEVKDWGLSHFWVTGPAQTLNQYQGRIRRWLDAQKQEEKAREAALKAQEQYRRDHRWDWLKAMFGIVNDKRVARDDTTR